MSETITPQELKLAKQLVEGPIPINLLLHIQESAASLEYGTIELVLNGDGAPIDVVTKQRKRFER